MNNRCDICEQTFLDPGLLEVDEDGLRICEDCRNRIKSGPVGESGEVLDENVRVLRGKNVGQIVLSLNLPYVDPYREIIDDAHTLHDRLKSTWVFHAAWQDGSTVWRSPDGSRTAIVSRDGDIRYHDREM